MRLKMVCYECKGEHTATAKHFPKQLMQMKSFPDPDKPERVEVRMIDGKPTPVTIPAGTIMRPVRMGVVCYKCVEKVNLAQLKKHIREKLGMNVYEVVTKHHIRKYFDEEKLRQSLVKGGRNEKERVNSEAGGAGTKHPGLFHKFRQSRGVALLSQTFKRLFIPKDRKG